MAGPTTEHLDQDIRELREAHEKLDRRVDEMKSVVGAITPDMVKDWYRYGFMGAQHEKELFALRAEGLEFRKEVDSRLTRINDSLDALRGDFRESQATVRFALKVAAWGVAILTPIVIGLVAFAVSITWHASKVDSRLGAIESRQSQAAIETPKK